MTAIAFGKRNGFFYYLLSDGTMRAATKGDADAIGWCGEDVPLSYGPHEPDDYELEVLMKQQEADNG